MQLRIARHIEHLAEVVAFDRDGLVPAAWEA
jgi:hypothetical protein